MEVFMADDLDFSDEDDADAYAVEGPDRLGVLSSARFVVEQGEQVWINRERLALVGAQLMRAHAPTSTPAWYERYHFFDGTERTMNWLLVLDALNFCFWAEKGQARWQVEYQGEIVNGYWAEAAALTRAVEEGVPLWDAEYLSRMSGEELAHILRGLPAAEHAQGVVIPLFEQRLENAREVGRVLLERYDGQFAHVVEEAGGSAVKLALLLADDFPSFHDVATYRNHEVHFFKRAQLCAADVYGAFGGKGWGAFSDLDRLTAFADYKVPQVLRHLGVLEYAPKLSGRVDKQELLEAGSEEEVELRATTIWACELLRREVVAATGEAMTAVEVDQRLWHLGQDLPEMKPYHRTRTISY